jgi:hypothetical protein
MSDRVISEAGPFLIGPEIEDRLRDGTNSNYTWEGTKQECLNQRAICLAQRATTVSLRPGNGGNWQLTATYAGSPEDEGGAEADIPVNQHDLEVNAVVEDYKTNAKAKTLFSEYAFYIVTKVYDWYKNGGYEDTNGYVSQTDNVTAWANKTPVDRARLDINRQLARSSIEAEATLAKKLFNRLVAGGGDSLYRYETTYRRRITAASFGQVQAAYTGVGQIWTAAEVVNFEGVPTDQWFGLPNTQFLKLPPRVSASAGGKTDIEYSYQGGFDNVSYLFYTAYSGAAMLDD